MTISSDVIDLRQRSDSVKKLRQIGKNLLFWVPVIVVSWLLVNYVVTNYEKGIYKAPGKMVQVYGNKMHIYSKGKGKNVVVLLPGLKTIAPIMDFKLLVNELSKKNRVVVIEPFGYGYSETTSRERTVKNISEEIYMALTSIGIKDKVVLMPQAESGIYAIYYANRYPDQVKAIVGIDCMLPNMKTFIGDYYKKATKVMKYAKVLGIPRIDLTFNRKKYLPDKNDPAYSTKDREIMKAITIWNLYNDNLLDERNRLMVNMEETIKMQLSDEISVLFFYTKGSKVSEFYNEYIRHSVYSELVQLDGDHYQHSNYYKDIVKKTTDFFKNIDNDKNH